MAKQKLCVVKNCDKPVHAKDFCAAHYFCWRRHGDPLISKQVNHTAPFAWLVSHKYYKRNDCLIWPFSRDRDGYGRITLRGKGMTPARMMCVLVYGEAPVGKVSAHSCGNGSSGCVNPRHLRWATRPENVADAQRHGVVPRGENHWMAKIGESDVRKIRSLAARGMAQKTIAEKFGVSSSMICNIVLRKNWAWLK